MVPFRSDIYYLLLPLPPPLPLVAATIITTMTLLMHYHLAIESFLKPASSIIYIFSFGSPAT